MPTLPNMFPFRIKKIENLFYFMKNINRKSFWYCKLIPSRIILDFVRPDLIAKAYSEVLTPCGYIDRLKMETRSASSATVSELFNGANYVVWSVQVKTYLIAQDLWDIVEGIDVLLEPRNEAALKVRTRKNAMALHVIQTSCEPRICLVISQITSANLAWDTLTAIKDLYKVVRDCDYLGISLSLYIFC